MRIALYVPSWPPGFMPNGIVTYASNLVPALRRLGHEVFLLTSNRTSSPDDSHIVDVSDGGRSSRIWNRVVARLAPNLAVYRSRSIAIVDALQSLLRQQAIDVCQIEDSFGWSYASSRLRMLPVVVRLHGPWFLNGQFDAAREAASSRRGRIGREGRAMASATAITAPSRNVLDMTEKYYGIRFPLSKVIPNAITPPDTEDVWSVDTADRNLLLFVGRFDRHKGGDIVLRAFARLASEFPKLRLLFVGPDSGLSESGRTSRHFHQFLGDALFDSVRNRIEYRGALASKSVQTLRSQAFLTIVASRYETFGNVVLEAMAAGSPLITTAVGAIPEIIQGERNGLLVASEDSEGIASACRRLLEDPVLASRLGQQALKDCRERYDPSVRARETEALYERAIARFRESTAH